MKQESSITTSLDDLAIKVPPESRFYPLGELPITDRLRNIFAHLGLTTIADLTPSNLNLVLDAYGFGLGTLNDLISIVERIEAGEFRRRKIENLDDLDFIGTLNRIDGAVSDLDTPYREFVLLRYGGVGSQHRHTLKEVGQHFGRTRQAMDMRENAALKGLRKAIGVELFDQLEYINATCLSCIVPFDPNLFKHLLQRKRISASVKEILIGKSEYYVRLIGDLVPTLPVWPSGHRPIARAANRDSIISRQLVEQLRLIAPCSLRQLYKSAIKHTDRRDLSPQEFLSSVSRSPLLRVEFLPLTTEDLSRWFTVAPDSRIDGRRKELGRQIHEFLESSSMPRKMDEIHSFVVPLEGMRKRSFSIRSLNFYLSRKKGIYLLGPRQFGTSKHFQLTQAAHRPIAHAAFDILSDLRRPLSAKDLVAQPNLSWLSHPNPYEVAEVLRSDERFVGLGRLIFALSDWDMNRRPPAVHLVLETLKQAGRPLTQAELLRIVLQSRSICATSITKILKTESRISKVGTVKRSTYVLAEDDKVPHHR